jgi:hypothetical protein
MWQKPTKAKCYVKPKAKSQSQVGMQNGRL